MRPARPAPRPPYLASVMQDTDPSLHEVAEEALRRVRDPKAFVHAFREAHRDEQLRRRQFVEALTPDVKAEWIDGEAVYHSPAREIHNFTTLSLAHMLETFSMYRTPLHVRVEKAMIELERDNFEPDICVWRAADHDFPPDLLLYPRPDLVVEVLSPRTRNRDLGKKKREYAAAGTHEYWIVDTDADTLTRCRNAGKQFETDETSGVGDDLVSSFLPGLSFPIGAIWEIDKRKAWTTALVTA